MAAGTRVLPWHALLHNRDLYLRPEGTMVKWQLSGCALSCAIVDAMREMALRG